MSEREYLALPEEKPYLEYIDGVVEQKAMVNRDHGGVVGQLDGWFFLYSREHGGEFGPERRVALGTGDYYLPDTAYWAADAPSGDDTIPTVAVEVRSPGESMRQLRDKCRAYLREGSAAAWLLDPETRTVEVFEGKTARRLREGDTLTCAAMPGFELPLAQLFGVLDD
jgi:Uma2 family endonuclease